MRLFSILLALLATEAVAQSSSSPPSSEASASEAPVQSPSGSPDVSAPSDSTGNVETRGPADLQTSANEDHWYSLYRGKRYGLQLDASLPDGAGLMVLFRPYWWLRANAGFAYNYLGAGIRGGVTVMPLRWAVTPTLSFDLGHYFSGDFTKLVTPSTDAERALLSDAAYNFWSAHLGLEFGSQDGFIFYLRAGISHLSAGLSNQNLTGLLNAAGPGHYQANKDGDFTALLPSVSLGFLLHIL